MAVTINVNGGTILTLGTGTPINADQQLSTAEVVTNSPTTDVATYGGASTITGQSKRTLHAAGYQDWNAANSVCAYLEENEGQWVAFTYDQYGGGTAGPTNPIVSGEILCVAPPRGGTVDQPEVFDLTFGIRGYAVDAGAAAVDAVEAPVVNTIAAKAD